MRHVPFSQRAFRCAPLIGLALACLLGAGAASAEPEPGRTDGEEGSEYGKGGYPYYGRLGQFYAEGFFGAAMVDIDPENEEEEKISSTDLMSGLYLGYKIEEWLSFQPGTAASGGDSAADLFSAGMRNSLDLRPFNYFFSLDAELYSPSGGDVKFGIVPGAGRRCSSATACRWGCATSATSSLPTTTSPSTAFPRGCRSTSEPPHRLENEKGDPEYRVPLCCLRSRTADQGSPSDALMRPHETDCTALSAVPPTGISSPSAK